MTAPTPPDEAAPTPVTDPSSVPEPTPMPPAEWEEIEEVEELPVDEIPWEDGDTVPGVLPPPTPKEP